MTASGELRWLVLVLAGCSKLLGVESLSGPGDGGEVDGNGAVGGSPVTPAAMAPWDGAYTGSLHAAGALRPTFRWDAVPDATYYELALDGTCSAAATCMFDQATVTSQIADTKLQPDNDLAVSDAKPVGRRYYWRLRACNANGCSLWSAARYLNVGRVRDDFNGDGYADLAIGALYGDRTVVYAGSPTGLATGSPPPTTTTISPATLVYTGWGQAVGDFNGDGYADIALGAAARIDENQRLVAVVLGGASGLAGAAISQRIDAPANANNFGGTLVSPGDVDGDGFDDVVVASQPAVVLYRGSLSALGGGVELTLPQGLVVGRSARIVGLGDVEGDGYPDVAVGVGPDRLGSPTAAVVYRGTGAGLALGPTVADPTVDFTGTELAGADLDRDGHADLIASRIKEVNGVAVQDLVVYPGSARGVAATAAGAPIVDPDNLGIGELTTFTLPDGAVRFTVTTTRNVTLWDGNRNRLRRITGADHFGSATGLCDCAGDGYPDLIVSDRDAVAGRAFYYEQTSDGLSVSASRVLFDSATTSNDMFGYSISR